jgi:MYXO-CTERM domain-containing protein
MRRAAGLALAFFLATIPGAVSRRLPGLPLPRPSDGEPDGERDEDARRAAGWWHLQRAFPAGTIPFGAHARGREAMRALRERRAARGKPGLKPPPPMGSPWAQIGPAPLDTSIGVLETPNLGPVAGRASAVAVDPTDSMTIYVGYGLGGVWKTSDGGSTWAPLTDFEPTLAVGSIAIDPAAPDTIYIGTGEPAPYLGYSGEGIFKSTDGGQTFTKIGGTTLDGFAIGRLFLDGAAGAMYATAFYGSAGRGQICNFDVDIAGQGLYRSDDAGATWKLIRAGMLTDLEVDTSVMPRRIFVGLFDGGALRSDDGGATWVTPAGISTKASRVDIAFSPADPTIVYAGMGLNGMGTVYVSQDSGKTFTPMPGAPDYCEAQCYYDNAVAADPTDPKTLYVGGNLCGIWKTSNGTDPAPTWANVSFEGQDCGNGQNWAQGFVHPDVHAIGFDPSVPGTVFAATDGGLSRSLDGGATWTPLTAGVGTLQIYALCTDPQDPVKMYGGAQDNGSFMRLGQALTWRGLVSGDGGPCAVDPKNSKLVLISSAGGNVFRTSNAFATAPAVVFETDTSVCLAGAPGCGDRTSFIAPLVGDPSTPNTFYVGTYKVYKTTTGGTASSWKAVSPDLTSGPASVKCPNAVEFPALDDALTVIAVAPSAPGTLYTGSQSGRIYTTTNGGGSWSRIDGAPLPARWVSGIAVDPRDPLTVFVSFSGFDAATPQAPGHVFRSNDGGMTWQLRDIGADVPVDALVAHPVGSDLLYAGTDAGLLVTTDGGMTWEPFDNGLPHIPVYAIAVDRAASALIVGTFGRSTWSSSFEAGMVAASPLSLSFSAVRGGAAPLPQAVNVTDTDPYGSVVSFTAASGAPWLSIDTTMGTLAGADPVVVNATVDPSQVGLGTFNTTLTITPGANAGPPIAIPVVLTVKAPPPPPPPAPAPAPAPTPGKKSGCHCHLAGDSAPPAMPAAAAAVAALAVLAGRRRRRG